MELAATFSMKRLEPIDRPGPNVIGGAYTDSLKKAISFSAVLAARTRPSASVFSRYPRTTPSRS